jgi:replicative DNA helicase
MAKELRTSVLILSQIDNATHKEGDKSPLLGFKGSGDIGQVADVAIRIKRIYERDSNSKYTNEYILSVKKNRSGVTGDLQYTIEFPSGRIAGQGEMLKENLEKVEERVDAETIFADIVEPINE